jgi:hypothetical protein
MTKPYEAANYFRQVVIPYSGDDCLIWPYAKFGNGYAHMADRDRDYLVHRRACEEVNGPAPSPEHEARHTCGNGHLGCCNPRHTTWGTHTENEADKIIHGTSNRGERCGTAKLSEADVLHILSIRGTNTHQQIAALYGVKREAITKIYNGRRWAHVVAS